MALSPPGHSLPRKQKGARDEAMTLRTIQKTSKALLATMEHRQRNTRRALEGQGHGRR